MIMSKTLKIYYKSYSTLGKMSCKMIGLIITIGECSYSCRGIKSAECYGGNIASWTSKYLNKPILFNIGLFRYFKFINDFDA